METINTKVNADGIGKLRINTFNKSLRIANEDRLIAEMCKRTIDDNNKMIYINEDKENADFIVKAVNNHHALVEALQDIIDCQYNPTKTLANLNGAISNAQELLNNINESK